MTTAIEYYQEGNLTAAIEAIADEIRNEPNNANKRAFLVELLCFQGDFERADKQLNTLVTLETQAALMVGTWRQLIRAAQLRQDVYDSGCIPDVIEVPTPAIENALALSVALRDDKATDITALIAGIDEKAVAAQYRINDNNVQDWRDLDDMNASILEVLASNGKYFWVDFSQVVELQFSAPERPLDLLWRKANITLTNGTEGEVFIPAMYPLAEDSDDATKLGRKTQWVEHNGLVRGQGLRTWLVGDEALSIMEFETMSNPALLEATA